MGGGGNDNEIAMTQAAEGAQNFGLGQAQRLAQNPPDIFGDPRRAAVNPLQTQAQNQMLGVAGGQMTDLAQSGFNANQMMLDPNFLSPDSNPYLQQVADYATDPIFNRLQRDILPQSRLNDTMGGGPGGSAGAIERGLATGEASRAAMGTRANIFSNAYQQGIGQQQNAINQIPMLQQSQMMPSRMMENIGGFRRAEDQAAIDESMQLFNEQQWQDEQALDRFTQRASPLAGFGTVIPGQPQQSPLQQVAGLGLGIGGLAAGFGLGGPE